MRIIYPGHRYEIDCIDGAGVVDIRFVKREPHHSPMPGILNQDLIRVLIDRVQVLDAEKPWDGNALILQHLRQALVLHECRAMIRHVEDGKLLPESVSLGSDGHFKLD